MDDQSLEHSSQTLELESLFLIERNMDHVPTKSGTKIQSVSTNNVQPMVQTMVPNDWNSDGWTINPCKIDRETVGDRSQELPQQDCRDNLNTLFEAP